MPVVFKRAAPTFTGYWGFRVEIFESRISTNTDSFPCDLGSCFFVSWWFCEKCCMWKWDKYEMPKARVSVSDEIIGIEYEKDWSLYPYTRTLSLFTADFKVLWHWMEDSYHHRPTSCSYKPTGSEWFKCETRTRLHVAFHRVPSHSDAMHPVQHLPLRNTVS